MEGTSYSPSRARKIKAIILKHYESMDLDINNNQLAVSATSTTIIGGSEEYRLTG